MKKYLLILLIVITGSLAYAQKFEECEDIKLDDEEDFVASEPKVIECVDYIFACKLDDPGKSRENAVVFMFRWAIEAPYDLMIFSWGTKLAKKHPQFIILQLAALVKSKLNNKEADEDVVQLEAATMVYKYIKDPQFRVEVKGPIKKFVAAGDKGILAEFIEE
ncbi:MAG: hypothetical protein IPM74_17305 [Crocinitomicaceae bacterium]|nr:hypothetical protein [Crocinitomicaceae bacterium]MBK8927605.1 hypothetical protein [Crocinitomicaceae bacterium]